MTNSITVVGTIATDPKRITTQSGVVLCSFRLASSDRRFDREQKKWVDGETTNWFGITTFRGLADHAHESFHKGERVIVSGRLRIRNWESGEKSGTSVDIEADAVGHDVRWGVSRFEKRVGASANSEDSGEAQTPWGVGEGDPSGDAQRQAEEVQGQADDTQRQAEQSKNPHSNEPDAALSEDGFLPAAA